MSLLELNILDTMDEIIGEWQDPYPAPVIEEWNDRYIVRDDLLEVGSKARFADHLVSMSESDTLVYPASPAQGYAQISLAFLCAKYNKKFVMWTPERRKENLTKQQLKAVELGADMRMVKSYSSYAPLRKAAREYVDTHPEACIVPEGLDCLSVLASVVRVGRKIPFTPKEVWTIGSTGTLSRGLQLAWPDADFHIVSAMGRKMEPGQNGRAKLYTTPWSYSQNVEKSGRPHFNSVLNYDAKAWPYFVKYSSKGALFWNVAGEVTTNKETNNESKTDNVIL